MRPLFAIALGGQARARHVTLGVRTRLLAHVGAGFGRPARRHRRSCRSRTTASTSPRCRARPRRRWPRRRARRHDRGRQARWPTRSPRCARPWPGSRHGDLDVQVPVDDGGEVGRLQAGVNQMVDGLRERHRLADLFGRHVGTEVARRALVEGAGLDSEQREASALVRRRRRFDGHGRGAAARRRSCAPSTPSSARSSPPVSGRGRVGQQVRGRRRPVRVRRAGGPARPRRPRPAGGPRLRRAHRHAVGEPHPGLDAAIGVSSGIGRRRQRRHRAALRVHDHRTAGERGGPPLRAGQEPARPGPGVRRRRSSGRATRRRAGRPRCGRAPGPAGADGHLRAGGVGRSLHLTSAPGP